jgi:excisionase family DNA binding protein
MDRAIGGQMDERLLLKPEECAARLGLSRATIYELIRSGALESLKIGASRRVSVRALEQFVERQRATVTV